MSLERDYTIAEVAEALGMSERWVSDRIREGAPHQRYSNRIRFTAAQVDQLRSAHTTTKATTVDQPITTGRGRRAS